MLDHGVSRPVVKVGARSLSQLTCFAASMRSHVWKACSNLQTKLSDFSYVCFVLLFGWWSCTLWKGEIEHVTEAASSVTECPSSQSFLMLDVEVPSLNVPLPSRF